MPDTDPGEAVSELEVCRCHTDTHDCEGEINNKFPFCSAAAGRGDHQEHADFLEAYERAPTLEFTARDGCRPAYGK